MTLSADLTGKRALVTGASSNGFGAHFSKCLAAAGAEIVVAARRRDALEALVAEISAAGGKAMPVQLDVNSAASVHAAVQAAGKLDILVNNAGVTHSAALLDQSEADFENIMGTNLHGAWRVATEVARSMQANGAAGSIINIASVAGLRPSGGVAPYGISKAALIHMTKQMALELARYNIRVNALAPGYFRTDLNRAFFETDSGKALIKRVPMRRLGALEDLDGALLLLASDASRFMTGSIIAIDGGHLVNSL